MKTLDETQLKDMLSTGFRLSGDHGERLSWVLDMALALIGPDISPDTCTQFLKAIADSWQEDKFRPSSIVVVEKLLNHGADPLSGTAALENAETSHVTDNAIVSRTCDGAKSPASPFVSALHTHNEELICLFIKAVKNRSTDSGPDVNRFVTHSGTPLISAIANTRSSYFIGDVALENMLLAGWDPNTKDATGNTLLHLAYNKNMVRYILNRGGTPNAKNADGKYPWDVWGSENADLPVSVSSGMKAQVKKHLKTIGASSRILTSSSDAEVFKAAYNGSKTGIPKSKDKLVSLTKKIDGFESKVNLLEMAILGFIDSSNHRASALNHIASVDKEGELWTDRALVLGVVAMMSDSITIAKPQTKMASLKQACIHILKACMKRGLIEHYPKGKWIPEAPPSIDPTHSENGVYAYQSSGDTLAPELLRSYSLCFDETAWDLFDEVISGIMKYAALKSDHEVSMQTKVKSRVLTSLISRTPPDGYPALYDITKKTGEFARANNKEIYNNIFNSNSTNLFLFESKIETKRISASPARGEKIAYAFLGICCMQPTSPRSGGFEIVPNKKPLWSIGLESMARGPHGLFSLREFLSEADKVEAWINQWEANIKNGEDPWDPWDTGTHISWVKPQKKLCQAIQKKGAPLMEKLERESKICSTRPTRGRARGGRNTL